MTVAENAVEIQQIQNRLDDLESKLSQSSAGGVNADCGIDAIRESLRDVVGILNWYFNSRYPPYSNYTTQQLPGIFAKLSSLDDEV